MLTGNRLLVSFAVLLGIGALFVVAGLFGLVTVTRPSRVMWYLNGTVNGLLTLVLIAVGVNQIVLSHEFGSIRDYYERRTSVTEFRKRVEQHTGTTTSSHRAAAFFDTLLATVSDTARSLQHDRPPEEDRTTDEITAVAESIRKQADQTNEELATDGASILRTLVITLDYDNSRHFDELRQLREGSPGLSEETTEGLERIEDLFVEIDAARQYLKTVVVERQLAQLSQLLIATGIPAVVVAAFGIFTYRDIAGLTVPFVLLVIVAGTLIVATLVPLVIWPRTSCAWRRSPDERRRTVRSSPSPTTESGDSTELAGAPPCSLGSPGGTMGPVRTWADRPAFDRLRGASLARENA